MSEQAGQQGLFETCTDFEPWINSVTLGLASTAPGKIRGTSLVLCPCGEKVAGPSGLCWKCETG